MVIPSPTHPLRRVFVLGVALALMAGLAPPGQPIGAATGDPVLINEVLSSHTDTDDAEFVELYGIPGTSLAGLSLVVIESDAGTSLGAIDRRLDFSAGDTIGGNGYLLLGNPTGLGTRFGVTPDVDLFLNYLENSSHTVAIVETSSLSGGTGSMLTGSEVPRDAVGLTDGGAGDTFFLGASVVGPDGGFLAPGGSRVTAGVDTDADSDWFMLDFNLLDPAPTPTAATPLGNQPVMADCGPALTVLEGNSAVRTVSASDLDGTVVDITIQAVDPASGGITIGATTPATEDGGIATADVSIADSTAAGTYEVTILATNDDAEPQNGTCTLSVTVAGILTIGEVQGAVGDTDNGATHRSTYAPPSGNGAGEEVYVRGVVTQRGRFPTNTGGQNYGFWLQSPVGDSDGDANSSDGIFVFMGGFTTLRIDGDPSNFYFPLVGDQVILRGPVSEFFSLTQLGNPFLVEVEETGIDVTDATEVETNEAMPPDMLADANRYWERRESMRFHLDAGANVIAARDVFPSTQDGELWVIRGDHPIAQRADPYTRIVYRDPHPLDDMGPAGSFDNDNGMRIMLQSHGLKWNAISNAALIAPARTYDTVTNELTGALYFSFSKYGIEIEQQLALENGVDPALNAPPSAAVDGVQFASSDYNVENLYDFRDDPFDGCDFADNPGCDGVSPPFDYVPASEEAYQQHLEDLAAQIAGPMHAPDLLMVQEAEDQDICLVDDGSLVCGATDDADGKPDTLQELALAITAAGGPTYDAAYDRDGADDRGIVSALMYRTDTVELLIPDAADPILGSAPTVDYDDGLAYNADIQNPKALNAELPAGVPGPIDPCDEDVTCVFTRDPQVAHVRVWRDGIGTSVFTDLWAVSNHFSSTPDNRVGQRTEQARYNAAIAEAILAADPDARIINAGDFNVYPRPDDPFPPGDPRHPSDQLGPMYDAGLHNLWDDLVADVPQSAYSYSFNGQAQTLDMQWADDNQYGDLVQVRAAHLNADFAADFAGDVARGASDHDPQVARWFTDVTFARLHALVDYYVATGDLPADKAFLFHNRLNRAASQLAAGHVAAARAQLMAFGNQAYDYAPPDVAASMEKEGDRLASQL